jgi:hypothetical protein
MQQMSFGENLRFAKVFAKIFRLRVSFFAKNYHEDYSF